MSEWERGWERGGWEWEGTRLECYQSDRWKRADTLLSRDVVQDKTNSALIVCVVADLHLSAKMKGWEGRKREKKGGWRGKGLINGRWRVNGGEQIERERDRLYQSVWMLCATIAGRVSSSSDTNYSSMLTRLEYRERLLSSVQTVCWWVERSSRTAGSSARCTPWGSGRLQ